MALKYKELEPTARFYRRVIEEVEQIPGVESAAFNDSLPLAGQDVREGANRLTIAIEGQSQPERERNPFVNAQIISPGYFRTMKIPLAQGRFFDQRDVTSEAGLDVYICDQQTLSPESYLAVRAAARD